MDWRTLVNPLSQPQNTQTNNSAIVPSNSAIRSSTNVAVAKHTTDHANPDDAEEVPENWEDVDDA